MPVLYNTCLTTVNITIDSQLVTINYKPGEMAVGYNVDPSETEIILPDTVQYIGWRAFQYNANLIKITGRNVKYIASEAFHKTELQEAYFPELLHFEVDSFAESKKLILIYEPKFMSDTTPPAAFVPQAGFESLFDPIGAGDSTTGVPVYVYDSLLSATLESSSPFKAAVADPVGAGGDAAVMPRTNSYHSSNSFILDGKPLKTGSPAFNASAAPAPSGQDPEWRSTAPAPRSSAPTPSGWHDDK